MAAALQIRGVPYRSIEEVESAVKELAIQLTLTDRESDRYDDISRHIADLLAALPDEIATPLFKTITGTDAPQDEDPGSLAADSPEVAVSKTSVTIDGTEYPICPMCNGDGFLHAEPPQDPTTQRCPACDGYGRVYTGSRKQGQETRACPICAGDGWVAAATTTETLQPKVAAAEVPQWPGALWNQDKLRWDPPEGDKPWADAHWNDIAGNWE